MLEPVSKTKSPQIYELISGPHYFPLTYLSILVQITVLITKA